MNKINIYYIIDDDADDRQFLMEALTQNDPSIQFFSASNGQEAILNLKNSGVPLPDVIFLDLNMPRINGKQCLAELKQNFAFKHIPVIICSTSSFEKEKKELMEMGAFYFLTKKSSLSAMREELQAITGLLSSQTIGLP